MFDVLERVIRRLDGYKVWGRKRRVKESMSDEGNVKGK